MPAKKMAIWAMLLGTMALTGCCRWCDRWCPDHHPPAAYPPVAAAAPACCVPATVCCPPGTVPAGGYQGYPAAPPAGQPWQRSYGAAPGVQPNCCE